MTRRGGACCRGLQHAFLLWWGKRLIDDPLEEGNVIGGELFAVEAPLAGGEFEAEETDDEADAVEFGGGELYVHAGCLFSIAAVLPRGTR